MRNILLKEMKLSAHVLSYLFILFGLMFFLPGYPVLCGTFFSALGIFQGFQYAREANDTVFSALRPIAKRDVVKGRYLFVCLIEVCTLLLMAVVVVLRMTVLADNAVFRSNALMNANLFALGGAFLLFGLFNWIFVGGFFKTAYKLGRPFVTYIVVAFIDHEDATVKTFYKEEGHFRLQPENDTMDPIILDEVEVLGKVIGLKRYY